MKIRMTKNVEQNEYSNNRRKEREEHKKFRQLRKERNNRWQSVD